MSQRRRDWALLVSLTGFELAVGAVALLLAWLLSVPLAGFWHPDPAALLTGALAGVAMFGLLLVLIRLPFGPLLRLLEVVRRLVGSLFQGRPILDLALIAAAAGVGEELLFRGFLQQWLTVHWGDPVGIVVAAVLFGVLHPLTLSYAVVASLFGLILGVLVVATGNLWSAIAAHALYDFLAILYLGRTSGGSPSLPEAGSVAGTAAAAPPEAES